MPTLLWFRRDLRLDDHPALYRAARDAAATGDATVALFVLDDALLRPAGRPRQAFLYRCLRDLNAALEGQLVVRQGNPVDVVPAVASEVGATAVHVSADTGPYGSMRDDQVQTALAALDPEVAFVRTGSPYAISPGRLKPTGQHDEFRVFSPFYRAWHEHGWPAPAPRPAQLRWAAGIPTQEIPPDPDLGDLRLPEAGEAAAAAAWERFQRALPSYAQDRDRPDRPATSGLSVYLKFGCLHPRTLLHALPPGEEGSLAFRRQLAWREFYAYILYRHPDSARADLSPRLAGMVYNTGPEADARFLAWTEGRTGYPLVDAGMRQLATEGWMHNRARLVTASFLVKDLHLPWTRGARHFLSLLADGDLASNSHGWQWVAGSGTDAAPYVRVFNPVVQAERCDPEGNYVRRYLPELRSVAGRAVHRPWDLPGGPPGGYPLPIVDHARERQEAVDRFHALGTAT
ncbi:MAG: cryptochrome/photolyase family protein [Mycobacteriales bacterium]